MCIRDRGTIATIPTLGGTVELKIPADSEAGKKLRLRGRGSVSYTHLRAHETVLDLVCRLLLEKKKTRTYQNTSVTTCSKNNTEVTVQKVC